MESFRRSSPTAIVLQILIVIAIAMACVQAWRADSLAREARVLRDSMTQIDGQVVELEARLQQLGEQAPLRIAAWALAAGLVALFGLYLHGRAMSRAVEATAPGLADATVVPGENTSVDRLDSLLTRIESAVVQVGDASTRAEEASVVLLRASERLSEEIDETAGSVQRLAQQIDALSARADEAASVARHGLAAANDGSRAVDNSIVGMNEIRNQIQTTSQRIKRLGESSQEVGEIVSLISDLTDRTNVLALNAAIQAASAGEAGRGFTLVAEEVQGLAERSGEATRRIVALIAAIQADTREAIEAMERSTAGVVSGAELADEAGRALAEIGRVSQRLARLIEDFSGATSGQAAQAGVLAQTIRSILRVAELARSETADTAGSIRDLAGLARSLTESVAGTGRATGRKP